MTRELPIFRERKTVHKENTVLCNLGFSSREPAVKPAVGFREGSVCTPAGLAQGAVVAKGRSKHPAL